jgi:hypothetical protein
MTTPRTAAGPDLLDRILRMESDLRHLTARTRRVIVEGTLTAYDAATHTATVEIDGVPYAGIPASYALAPYAMRAGVNAQATAGVVSFNAATPGVGCVLYLKSATPPPDPFDPITGHKHTGLVDDAPTLP